ncbi:hypothetical protein ARMGADRAFT_1034285 [Armillaria gallica]|uniref:Uncharacterized protein n=1 Tax=Armillaria gallica TaxID=47427 RepID=A0A2H3CY84_ARMGA|nr:hypothetical protein ARMGADRAFT_1034285 [Armillaria gallica]
MFGYSCCVFKKINLLRNRKEQTGTVRRRLLSVLVAGISCYPDSENKYGCRGVISDFDTFELLAFWYHRTKAMSFLLCTPIMSSAGLGYQGHTEAIFSSGLGPASSMKYTGLNAGYPCEGSNGCGVSTRNDVGKKGMPRRTSLAQGSPTRYSNGEELWHLSTSQNFLQLVETTACLPVVTTQTSATNGSSSRIYRSW